MHNAYVQRIYCQLESISSTGKANINYICPSFIETYNQIPVLSSTIAHFLPYKFPCFFSRWSLTSILCLFVCVCGFCICATIKVDRNFNLCIYLNDLWPEIQMHKLFFLELTTSFNQIYWIAFCQCERRPSMNQMIDCIRSFFCSTIRHAFSSLNKIAAKKILFFPFGRSLTHSHHNKHYFLYILITWTESSLKRTIQMKLNACLFIHRKFRLHFILIFQLNLVFNMWSGSHFD